MPVSQQMRANSMRNQWLLVVALWSAVGWGWANVAVPQDSPAGNEEVARVMREFEGRGDLGDDSAPASPTETIARLKVPDDLQVELVAGEPNVTQPIHISFDFKGRMWVVQYRQYPFPAGLKVVRYDQHLRAVFDSTPIAPPNHVAGADCVTVWEDTNGDGSYDTYQDVIEGLNIATSVAVSTSGIWVMNPPYLLFYPDADHDAKVDGDPTVHLSGFGLEDTHAVANSLRLGPDGWLYGANGSTTTASIHAPLSGHPDDATSFQGQCIWRYHPETHQFEIFAEGGGNTFGLEIEESGLTFSGTNHGNTRGMFYPQGSYGTKSWGKHGPLTNPHAYGFFNHMRSEGDRRRFTQALVVYQDNVLPQRYRDQSIAINPLQRCVISSELIEDTSTFRTRDFETTIQTDDRWFRPVAIAVGPDGAVYFADWYDTRLTHVDPRDNWHKTSGRVYRLTAKNPSPSSNAEELLPSRTRFDMTAMPDDQLLRLLAHPSRTIRFLALEVIVPRIESSGDLQATLGEILRDSKDERRLLALWALHRGNVLSDDALTKHLTASEPDPDLRRWAIRLLGDNASMTNDQQQALVELAKRETDVHVRSQLASTAARLHAEQALPILREMMLRESDQGDLHLPLLIWWGLEAHCKQHADAVADLFADERLWRSRLVRQTILARLMQRLAAEGSNKSYLVAANLLAMAPDDDAKAILIRGFEEAFVGRKVELLPDALQEQLAIFRKARPGSDLPLRLRQGDVDAIKQALQLIEQAETPIRTKVELIETLGEIQTGDTVAVLRRRLQADRSDAVKAAALQALSRFSDERIGSWIASAYQSSMDDASNLRETAIRVLSSREQWASVLMDEIDAAKINVERVPADVVLQMQAFENAGLRERVASRWGTVRATPAEKQIRIAELQSVVRSSSQSNLENGKTMFTKHCGTCHRLFGEGGKVGPDLTGYERSNLDFLSLAIIDPSAAIREEFTNYQLLTADGQVLSGLLENQTPETVTMRTAEGNAVRVDRDDIESLQASPVSLMPENILDALSTEDVRDLLAYLQQPMQIPLTSDSIDAN
ncbi:membrane-bound dehydrogenase domain protein [Rhodopirellula baltica SH28]|uniref:Membrane-bound dehydrogenase domain protein n=1 Tax=Rhodopirellula baltica SH28 TaxID=993517 RepID=K5DF24_RHOBT|nr:HEAT repeat domain-containing protein [Rhodopirellula baltica]EKK01063.1 membrane-bound dehydrogenase domain protein [Rhodopirellula baltica SH28]